MKKFLQQDEDMDFLPIMPINENEDPNEKIEVPAGDEKQGQFFITIPLNSIKEKKSALAIEIFDSSKLITTVSNTLMAPVNLVH